MKTHEIFNNRTVRFFTLIIVLGSVVLLAGREKHDKSEMDNPAYESVQDCYLDCITGSDAYEKCTQIAWGRIAKQSQVCWKKFQDSGLFNSYLECMLNVSAQFQLDIQECRNAIEDQNNICLMQCMEILIRD